ncbi:MAG TPA: DUF5668 domain-containing protein [candidate division Zixibacteria bacterium]|jgi:uncharacterized membrane protein
MEKSSSSKEWGSGKTFVGTILLGLGILFLLSNWGIIPSLGKTWPLILIIVGLAFLLGIGGKEKGSTQTPSQPADESFAARREEPKND